MRFPSRHSLVYLRAALAPWVSAVLLAGGVGCAVDDKAPAAPVFAKTEGLAGCDAANVAARPNERCFTFRAVAGVSMGGGTAGRIGFRHPELWDVVGIMGTPFADNDFFYRMLQENQLGGFCPLEQLEQAMANGKTLDEVDDPEVFCGVHDVFPLEGDDQVAPGTFPAVEGSRCSMFRSDFNHWYRGPDAGRGGSFSRNSLLEVVHDLFSAFGNPFYANPVSDYFPPGVPETWRIAPRTENSREARKALCESPVVLEGFYNREYNPEGTYPVITFCDGNQKNGDDPLSGNYFPDERDNPFVVEFLLAVDLNGNGRRDYGEPVIINNQERFRDCGSDGLCDGEAGDTEDDDWDPLTNADGKEGNGRLDDGEVFDDDGLDGVPATGDFGEGDDVFSRAPALQALLDDSPGALMEKMPDNQANRLDVWMDAGIRDFLNTSQTSNALYAQLKRRIPNTRAFNDFSSLPFDPEYTEDRSSYFYYMSDYSREAAGQVTYLRYGDTAICPGSDTDLGKGNHVGNDQIVNRIFALFSFLSARMPAQGRDESFGGELASLGPTGRLSDFAFMSSMESKVLGRNLDFGVMLPPDYFLPEAAEQTYPVLYFFHGQGMKAEDLVALGIGLLGPMKDSVRADRVALEKSDLQRAIIIWADGNCLDDACYTGNFYADFRGLPRQDRNFESAFYELARHVEGTYRARQPEFVPLNQVDQ